VSIERMSRARCRVEEIEDGLQANSRRPQRIPRTASSAPVARGHRCRPCSPFQEGTVILHTRLSAGGSRPRYARSAVRILSEQTELQERLRAEPALIPRTSEEEIRLESPFRYLMRQSRSTRRLGGRTFHRAGAAVILFWRVRRIEDPAEYDDPDA